MTKRIKLTDDEKRIRNNKIQSNYRKRVKEDNDFHLKYQSDKIEEQLLIIKEKSDTIERQNLIIETLSLEIKDLKLEIASMKSLEINLDSFTVCESITDLDKNSPTTSSSVNCIETGAVTASEAGTDGKIHYKI